MTKVKLYREEQVKRMMQLARETYASENQILLSFDSVELPSDEEIIPVKALEEDGDWYLIPNELYEEFKNDTYNEEMVESGGFDDKWYKYKTSGDLNLIQLYVKIQGGNKCH